MNASSSRVIKSWVEAMYAFCVSVIASVTCRCNKSFKVTMDIYTDLSKKKEAETRKFNEYMENNIQSKISQNKNQDFH